MVLFSFAVTHIFTATQFVCCIDNDEAELRMTTSGFVGTNLIVQCPQGRTTGSTEVSGDIPRTRVSDGFGYKRKTKPRDGHHTTKSRLSTESEPQIARMLHGTPPLSSGTLLYSLGTVAEMTPGFKSRTMLKFEKNRQAGSVYFPAPRIDKMGLHTMKLD